MRNMQRVFALMCISVMLAVHASASCGPDNCLGPCNYEELLWDTRFSGNCPQWNWSGSTRRVKIGTNWSAELYGSGSVDQTVTTNAYSSMSVAFDVQVVVGSVGTERLYVEILRGSTILETVAVVYPTTSQTYYYSVSIANYSNDVIAIRFRYNPSTAPGNTIFRIDNAVMFGMD